MKRTDLYQRPTALQLEGLEVLLGLAEADVQVDEERWPPRHLVHGGLAYLRKLVGFERQLRRWAAIKG